MSRGFASLCFALLLLAAARARAAPATLQVEVIDIAGGTAYVAPGEAAGLRVGQQVQFGRHSFAISKVSAAHAAIELQQRKLKRGDKGRAQVSDQVDKQAQLRKEPRALSAFVGQWPKPLRPADSQHPKAVPLGPTQASGTTRALLSLNAAGSSPLGDRGSAWARGELRARVTAEPFQAPLRLDLDAALQLWAASGLGYDQARASRPLVRVRALELSYGQSVGLLAAAGRLRYAASTLGQLDGIKLQTPLPVTPGLRLAAFGGFVPDPLSGKPTSDSARFGAELAWEDLSTALRPRMSLLAQASRFDGALDERRLQVAADIFPGRSHMGAYVIGSLFDRDNPWNARAQELSAAGASVETRFGELQINARFDMRRPERSRWLESFLPAGWFCTSRVNASRPQRDVCRGSDARLLAQGDIGLYRQNLALNGGVYVSRTRYVDSEQLAGFANASVLHIAQTLHLDAGLFGQTGSLIRSAAVSVGAGALLAGERLDLSIQYRPAITRYYADTSAFVEHAAGASAAWLIGPSFRLNLSADLIAGRDLSVLLMQSTLQWRPEVHSGSASQPR